ncbi:MAG: hypothetical protein QF687_04790 [Nitrospinaceae bacterium]|jgi:hypothetical protein|nr:hypothetical protein [Nitrospinaceae bacterium]
MLILLIGQYIFHRLIVWVDESELSLIPEGGFFSIKELSTFAGLMMAGTWTLPTFAMFERSLGIFFLCALFLSNRDYRVICPVSAQPNDIFVKGVCAGAPSCCGPWCFLVRISECFSTRKGILFSSTCFHAVCRCGAFGMIYRLEEKLGASVGKIILVIILFLITVISGNELLQVTWPDRLARQPFDRVAKFVKKLGPNDLIMVSTGPHVEFYLYGGMETQKRVGRILNEGKRGDIYFVEYGEPEKSDTKNFLVRKA